MSDSSAGRPGQAPLESWQRVSGTVALSVALLLLTTQRAHADDNHLIGEQLNLENDFFVRGKNTDRWYTHGTRFTWTYKQNEEPAVERTVKELADRIFRFDADRTVSYSIGQNIYTPEKINVSQPQPQDRPWAGWLYGGAAFQQFADKAYYSTEFKLGVVGPASLADQVQMEWHHYIHAVHPAGWNNQVRPRLGMEVSHLRLYSFDAVDNNKEPHHFAFQLGAGGTLGDVRTFATANAGVVIGDLQGADPPFFMSSEGDFVVQDYHHRELQKRIYLFGMLNGTAVAYNYLLTGPVFNGENDIKTRPFVGALQYGISIPFGDRWRLQYAVSAKTSEFKSNISAIGGPTQHWGMVSISRDLDP